ncbi:MAG: hypothetical protein ACFFDU_00070 [Candidatus Thorarchaeota archaeon]
MTEQNPPLLWVLDYVIPDFTIFGEKITLNGELLIASRQLFSFLQEEVVRSAFIGPGVVKGQVLIKGKPVDVEHLVGAVIFDPTKMRPREPIPVLDILNPEILDPLEQASVEQVQEIIRKLIIKKGSVDDSGQILKVTTEGGLPTTLLSEQRIVPRNISLISGLKKARFLLGGQKNRLYTPFKDALQRNRFSDPSRIWTFRIDTMEFEEFNPESFDEWIIIEMQSGPTDSSRSSQVVELEFNSILTYLLGNREYFIFDD